MNRLRTSPPSQRKIQWALVTLVLLLMASACRSERFQEKPALLLQAAKNQEIAKLEQALERAGDPYARGTARGELALALWNKGDHAGGFAAAARALHENPLAPEALGVYAFALERAGQSQAAAVFDEICARSALACTRPRQFQADISVNAADAAAVKQALLEGLAATESAGVLEAGGETIDGPVFLASLTRDQGVWIVSYVVREGGLLRGEGIVEYVQESNREAALKTILADVDGYLKSRQLLKLSSANGFLRGTLSGCVEPALEIAAEQSAVYVQQVDCRLHGEVPDGSVSFNPVDLAGNVYEAPAAQSLMEAEALVAEQKYEAALALLEATGSDSEPGAEALLRGGGIIQSYLKDDARAHAWYQRALERTRNADLHAEALIGLARTAPDDAAKRRYLKLVVERMRGATARAAAERELRQF